MYRYLLKRIVHVCRQQNTLFDVEAAPDVPFRQCLEYELACLRCTQLEVRLEEGHGQLGACGHEAHEFPDAFCQPFSLPGPQAEGNRTT